MFSPRQFPASAASTWRRWFPADRMSAGQFARMTAAAAAASIAAPRTASRATGHRFYSAPDTAYA